MPKDRFPVNVLDPKDVRAKMPQLKELLAAKRQEQTALNEQVALLERIVGPDSETSTKHASGIAHVSGGGTTTARGRKAAPAQDRAVEGLVKAGQPMGPSSLYKFMLANDMDVPDNANTLGANLWAAAKAGKIVKAPNGVYAPLGFPTDRPLTDYVFAGENGFPVPSAGHPLGIQPAVQESDQK